VTATRETEAQRVFERLKSLILQNRLPAGAPLSHSQLCRDLQTSRTPVREALSKLEGLGLVMTVPHRGTFVSQLGLHDFLEITQIRALLEPFAARQAAGRVPAEALDALERRLRALNRERPSEADFAALHAIDDEAHRLVGRAGGNRRLDALAETLRSLCQQFSFDSRLRFDTMAAELHNLLAALRAADADAAEAIMRRHISNFGEALPHMIDE
jgi:DNA-binding GntR family transcriptional regulator